jgi:hypothetical protein
MEASEIQSRAGFTAIRYAQCWEDSKLLTAALAPSGKHCLSIGSAGDNSFALLAGGAASVTIAETSQVPGKYERNPITTVFLSLDRGHRPFTKSPCVFDLIWVVGEAYAGLPLQFR